MFYIIVILIILGIWAISKRGCFFSEMTFGKYLLLSSFFSIALFINRALQPGFTRTKFIFSLIASILILLLFSSLGYLFFNKLCPARKGSRYLYFSAYLIFLIASSSQYPFTFLLDMVRPQEYITAEKDIVDYYKPTAELFGIKELKIKLLEEDTLGAFVISYGKEATIVLTRGLQQLLNKEELRFVMAHEFAHYYLGHYKLRVILAIVGLLLFFVLIYGAITLFTKDYKDSEFRLFLRFIPVQLLLAAFLSLIPLWICRNQEIEADLYAISVTGDRASALRTFEKTNKEVFTNQRSSFFDIFEIHPSIEERVKEIENLTEK